MGVPSRTVLEVVVDERVDAISFTATRVDKARAGDLNTQQKTCHRLGRYAMMAPGLQMCIQAHTVQNY